MVNKKENIPKGVKTQGLFLHQVVTCCQGCIQNADLPWHTELPIPLPKDHYITKLMINKLHQLALHKGSQEILCKIKENFWTPLTWQAVKTQLRTCYVCKLLEDKKVPNTPAPPLPAETVEDSYPFTTSGIDYTGAIYFRDLETKKFRKDYTVLLTCATIRVIHFDVATDMTAETFLNVFSKFVARCSCTPIIISDNAANFKVRSETLTNLFKSQVMQEEIKSKGCFCKFITPRAVRFGGFKERLIGCAKSCL